VIRFFGFTVSIDLEVRLILLAMVAGGLGTLVHTITSFADFVGNRMLAVSWVPWFVLRPFIGMALAAVFYFVIRGTTLIGDPPNSAKSFFWVAGMSGLVGMFSRQGVDKLNEVFTTLFRPRAVGRDDKRSDALQIAPPTIKSIAPSEGPAAGGTMIQISGTGFRFGARVTCNDIPATNVVVRDPMLLTAVTPPCVEGTVDVSVINVDGQLATRFGGYTFLDQNVEN
jgi:hypothetical protein